MRHSLRGIWLESQVLFFQHGGHWSLVPCNNPQRLAGLRLRLVDSLMIKSQQVSAEVADSGFALTTGLWLGGWVSLRQPAVSQVFLELEFSPWACGSCPACLPPSCTCPSWLSCASALDMAPEDGPGLPSQLREHQGWLRGHQYLRWNQNSTGESLRVAKPLGQVRQTPA